MNSAHVYSYGNLDVITTLPESICCTVIKLDDRITRYGRSDDNDFQYHDSLNVRVPRNAFNIIFWKPSIEILINNGGNWRTLKDLWTIIHIDTSQNIKVNGVKLTMGENDWNYGRLYSENIIIFFDQKKPEKFIKFLKFRCDFNFGTSKRKKKEDEPRFTIEKQKVKYMQIQMRKSSQSKTNQFLPTPPLSSASCFR